MELQQPSSGKKPVGDGMPGVLIVAHAPIASALVSLVEHTGLDHATALAAFDMPAAMTREDAALVVRAMIAERSWTTCLLLVDLPGAGTHHVAMLVAEQLGNIDIVTGVNAPMLLSVVHRQRDMDLDSLARLARSRGRRGVDIALRPGLSR